MPAKKKRRKNAANQTERKDNTFGPCDCGWDQCTGRVCRMTHFRHQQRLLRCAAPPKLVPCDCGWHRCTGQVSQSAYYRHQSKKHRVPVDNAEATHASKRIVFAFLCKSLNRQCGSTNSQATVEAEIANHVRSMPLQDPTRALYPRTWEAAVAFVAKFSGIPMAKSEKIHVCRHDCLLFYGAYSEKQKCPSCDCSRFTTNDRGEKAAYRVYEYIPLIPRLKRMLALPKYSELLSYVVQRVPPAPGVIEDVMDGARWRDGYLRTVGLSKYNWAFFLGADGLSVSDAMDYSVTPLLLTNLLLPPHLRKSWRHLLVLGLIPGPGSNNVEAFLAPFLGEMDLLSHNHEVWMRDVLTGSYHLSKAVLLASILDTRGIAKISCGNQHPGKVMCHRCGMVGCRANKTTVYLDTLRDLHPQDPLRQQLHAHRIQPETLTPVDAAPCFLRTRASVMAAARASEASPLSVKHAKHPSKVNGMQTVPVLASVLGYDAQASVHADFFHQQSNDGKKFAKAMHGSGNMVWTQAQLRCERTLRFRFLQTSPMTTLRPGQSQKPNKPGKSKKLGRPPWQLTAEEWQSVAERNLQLRVPREIGTKPRDISVKTAIGYLKGHDWKLWLGPLGIYMWADCYLDRPAYRRFLFHRCQLWPRTLARRVTRAGLASIQREWHSTTAQGELLMPTPWQSPTEHFNKHLARTIDELGTAAGHWMFGDERMGERLVSMSRGKNHIEAGIVRQYLAAEVINLIRVEFPDLFPADGTGGGDGYGAGLHFARAPGAPTDPTRWVATYEHKRELHYRERTALDAVVGYPVDSNCVSVGLITNPNGRTYRRWGARHKMTRVCDALQSIIMQTHVCEYSLPDPPAEDGYEYDGIRFGLIREIVQVWPRGHGSGGKRGHGSGVNNPPSAVCVSLQPMPVLGPDLADPRMVPSLPLVAPPGARPRVWIPATAMKPSSVILGMAGANWARAACTHFAIVINK
jgi:hypothetical protein